MGEKQIMKRDEEYINWIDVLCIRYQQSQVRAAISVNAEMLVFYWSLGRDIVDMSAENKYGSGFFAELSRDMKRRNPDAHCFSETNLRYMKRFYELFSYDAAILPQAGAESRVNADTPILPQAGAELPCIPWGHIKLLCDKCKGDRAKAEFYARKTVENNWSRAVLLNFLGTDLYERQGKAASNFAATLPAPQGDLAQEITKDPYNFDFLTIRQRYDERELKDALMDSIAQFLMELGSGFALMGREYRLQVGQTEQWIDLLFYHARLHCYVVIEVKVTAFEPGFVGQLGTYVAVVDDMLATEGDAPTIGLLICRDKDDVLVRYALNSSSQPIGISEYELSKLLPEDFKGSLPTIEEIEAELEAGIDE